MPLIERRILKDSLHRSVRLEIDAAGAHSVVKRFASRTFAAATLDRARASREHRLLGDLSARGLPTPRPLGLERVDGGWEVRMEWIAGAAPLAQLLAARASWPLARERAARTLAELLAALHAAGVDHPDLHPGNVLLDSHGRAWAIDFHKARRARKLRVSAVWRDLVSLAAGVRESTSRRFRARFLLTWLRNAPHELASALLERCDGARSGLAESLESAASARRREAVFARRARWLRESSSCRVVDGSWSGFERAGNAASLVIDGLVPRDALARDTRAMLLEALEAREARAVWCCAARLEEHSLPALRPRAFCQRPRTWLWLQAERAGRPCSSPVDVRGARALHSLGWLCAQLADRGLRVTPGPWPVLWRDERGSLSLGAVLELEADPRAGDGIDLVRTLALADLSLEHLTPRERAAYAAGIVAGAALGARETARLRARLRHV